MISSILGRSRPGRAREARWARFVGVIALLGRATSANSARMPPSPSLSARMTKSRYLTETTSMSDQKTSDRTPRTLSASGATPCGAVEALLERVERRRADVAVDDAERAQRQLGQPGAVRVGTMGNRRSGCLGHEVGGVGRRSGMMNDLHSGSETAVGR